MTRFFVMAGLVPAIHVFPGLSAAKTWMPGTRPGMTKLSYNAPILLGCFFSQALKEHRQSDASRRMTRSTASDRAQLHLLQHRAAEQAVGAREGLHHFEVVVVLVDMEL